MKSKGRSLNALPDTCDKYETLIQSECVIYKQSSNKGKYIVICTMKKRAQTNRGQTMLLSLPYNSNTISENNEKPNVNGFRRWTLNKKSKKNSRKKMILLRIRPWKRMKD